MEMDRAYFEELGDRHKAYEMCGASAKLMPGLPVVARLDGRAFHTFTKGLRRPYDERLSAVMVETTKYLVSETQATLGYTQSDEITLAWLPKEGGVDARSVVFFDGRSQKLVSILAAMCSVKFNQLLGTMLASHAHLLPVFDARAYGYPNCDLAAEVFLWRELDARRNSVTAAAHAHYPHRELQRVGMQGKLDLLRAKGVEWEAYPEFFKRGTYVGRRQVSRCLTVQELERIPEKHRPTGPVVRSVVEGLKMPELPQEGCAQVLFGAC